MTLKSNKYLRSLPVAMLALAVCSSVHADNGDSIDITFRANIRDTTCDMTINDSDSSSTIIIGADGKVSLGDIIKYQTSEAASGPTMAQFALKIKNCPESVTGIKASISGATSGYDSGTPKTILLPGTGETGPTGVGLKFSRVSAPTSYFAIFANETETSDNDAEVIKWSPAEIDSKQVDLVARLVTTRISGTTPAVGAFQATATFNFSYE